MQKRRRFLQTMASFTGAAYLSPQALFSISEKKKKPAIACQQYPWQTFFKRNGKTWDTDKDFSMQQLAASGFGGFESTVGNPKGAVDLKRLSDKYQLQNHSLYVNSVLHDTKQTDASIKAVLEVAKAVKPIGVKIIVTNPSPIRWGGPEDKKDKELKVQAKALDQLGQSLRELGMTLAYHNHDAEMRNSAREFHHMMMGTDPKNVKLCLDAHWIYRGSGDSQVALFDIVDLYLDRIVELHLRQSVNGIWTEEFKNGDIDYLHLAKVLKEGKIKPHLVLEQAVEKDSPNTMGPVKAHQIGLDYLKEVFEGFY